MNPLESESICDFATDQTITMPFTFWVSETWVEIWTRESAGQSERGACPWSNRAAGLGAICLPAIHIKP